jgi:hypothetical protein
MTHDSFIRAEAARVGDILHHRHHGRRELIRIESVENFGTYVALSGWNLDGEHYANLTMALDNPIKVRRD